MGRWEGRLNCNFLKFSSILGYFDPGQLYSSWSFYGRYKELGRGKISLQSKKVS